MSYLEEIFAEWLTEYPLIPTPERQYRFHPTRRWLLDFAWPSDMFAVEVDGISSRGGGHQNVKGYLNDAEKMEAALMHGWTVYRVPGPWIAKSKTRIIKRPEIIGVVMTRLRLLEDIS